MSDTSRSAGASTGSDEPEDSRLDSPDEPYTQRIPNYQRRRDWLYSPQRAAQRTRYMIFALSGTMLVYAGILYFIFGRHYFAAIGISERLGAVIAVPMVIIGIILVFAGFISQATARDRFYAAQERAAKGAVDRALDDVTGPDDLMGLMRANRKQMDAYDALARSQAQTSYRASQIAMAIGLVILAAGIAIAIFAHSNSTKYAAAIITASGAAVGGFITRTFINVHLHASNQMNFYFRQPLVQSYLLSAERLAQRLPEREKTEQVSMIMASAMSQVDPSRANLAAETNTARRRRLKTAPTASISETGTSD